ncbi:AraC family transcriptional regulator [Serratia rhizosphaerae]|uniref:AraC family transcriptional regulator n=1 Tax=Serratia TaxID=613 RepID=UPI000CF6152E|nr:MULTISPECIES: AraC family transcriptional regulator [Serratia]MBU3892338.1 AraC family transcriptional regulator [Serratia rubidaea]AVJ17663.1 AraC family transcriptional regulator [Serratia sp. MYb239]MCA4823959.1 AraC family transcriptional regulator [Serratia rubidaea]MEB6337408.1 AraC family transcriptional regulator [Serratia rhizosphaerae]QNK30499.1 AraC family transcriptional regulator [Serratia sp. JUb9]
MATENPNSDQKNIADMIVEIAQNDGDYSTAISSLTIHRRSVPTAPVHCIYQMGLGVVVQGAKEVMLAGKLTRYSAGESMLTTIDLPVVSHVTQASQDEPFLGLVLTFDPRTVVQTAALMPSAKPVRETLLNPLSVEPLDEGVTGALQRLIKLLAEPDLIGPIAPLIVQEIIIRLLASNHGPQLRHLATAGSPGQNIARVVGWLKQNFTRSVCIDELAASAYMSPSTFRQHFRAVTGVSPLQYQKKLRLQEARQQMLSKHLDAGSAALIVGYESASQFSREYRREFGESPQRDIKRMRLHGE